MMIDLDLFAGPGGWDEGARHVGGWDPETGTTGIQPLGLEIGKAQCATARAAGHARAQVNIAKADPLTYGRAGVRGLIASPPCFIAGTPVLTRRGSVAIENVVVGDEVWTHRNRWRPVTATMSREADVVRVGPTTSTADHPFYSREAGRLWRNDTRQYRRTLGEPEWTPAVELQGRFLASPLAITAGRQATFPCSPWLAGRYVADGWTGRDGVMIAIGAGKAEEFERRSGLVGWKVSTTTCDRYTLPAHELAAWLRENFGHGAPHKTLPTWLLGAPREQRQEFLQGYLSGDGTAKGEGWDANTVSPHLASQLRLLALSLGYTSQVRENVTADTTVIEGREVRQRNYWTVSIRPNDSRYTEDADGLHWFKQRRPVTPAGRSQVYDITVAEDHSFVAWGYVVHNCQGFSTAGKGEGRRDSFHLLRAIPHLRPDNIDRAIAALHREMKDDRSLLALEPLRWTMALNPRWLAWEQVPAVLPLWEAIGERLRKAGYSVATGILNAEQYGVPQTRRRAILVARSDGKEARLPVPTHSRYYSREPEKLDEGVEKWVSMAEALGWGADERVGFPRRYDGRGEALEIDGEQYRGRDLRPATEPAFALTEKARSWERFRAAVAAEVAPRVNNQSGTEFDLAWPLDRPAPVIAGRDLVTMPGANANRFNGATKSRNDGIRVTVAEAAVLQSFPADYPWQGSKTEQFQQVGDAVPPRLAYHILKEITS